MALIFGAATSDRIDINDVSSLQNLDGITIMCWLYPTTFTPARTIYNKDNRLYFRLPDGSGNLEFVRSRVGGDTNYLTDDTPLVLNTWNFIACTFDTSAGAGEVINLYRGDLSTPATESSYGTSDDGSGALLSDAGGDVRIGNDNNQTRAFQGSIADTHLINSTLTLDQINAHLFRFIPHASSLIRMLPGYAGTGTQPDWSGNGHSGAVTGTSIGDHVPLRSPFGDPLQSGGTVPRLMTSGGVAIKSSDILLSGGG